MEIAIISISQETILKNIAQQVLPNHLWINHRWIFHIDRQSTYFNSSDEIFEKHHKIMSMSIGYLWFVIAPDRSLEKDVIQMVCIHLQDKFKPFHKFLQEVGGDVNMYKELVTLATGINPW